MYKIAFYKGLGFSPIGEPKYQAAKPSSKSILREFKKRIGDIRYFDGWHFKDITNDPNLPIAMDDDCKKTYVFELGDGLLVDGYVVIKKGYALAENEFRR